MNIIKHKNLIDIDAPVYMTKLQRGKFISGMKDIFGESIEVKEVIEKKKEMGEISRNPKKFTVSDLICLTDPNFNNDEIAIKLKKSKFAIQMKRGPFLIEIREWAKKKGIEILNEKEIKEFLQEK